MEGIKCILLDIEGTVCSISFVKEVLFPYAINALPEVLAKKWDDPVFKPYRDAFPEEHRKSPGILQAHVEDLTKRDVKIAYLKNLQGFLWEEGYKSGAYSTSLFPDVVPQLRQWKEHGYSLAIYSSGSVFAQKLLFGHVQSPTAVTDTDETPASAKKRGRPDDVTEDQANEVHAGDEAAAEPPTKKQARRQQGGDDSEAQAVEHQSQTNDDPDVKEVAAQQGNVVTTTATTSNDAPKAPDTSPENGAGNASQPPGTEDLTGLFVGWFDTTNAGLKTESGSYAKIAEALERKPEEILFLSDNVKEVDAAIAAKMQSIVVDRPGDAPLSDDDKGRLEVVESLAEIELAEKS